jgi:nitric oxide dioxygenase
MPLSTDQVQIIKATAPILAEHGKTITVTFYDNMLREHEELRDVFNIANQVNKHQPIALAHALYAYATHIDDLGALSPAVELICQKHASLYIRPEQYEIVGKYLLAAMKQVLGDALTQDIHDAWAEAYWQLAKIMIGREDQLMQGTRGWTDWRDMRIDKKVEESEVITSFYLVPVDGKPLPTFLPGQYISIMTHVPALGHNQARQYSLSESPREDYYRISVKKETGLDMADPKSTRHPGYISNILHESRSVGDVLRVSHPFGEFVLEQEEHEPDAPVVLLSAGVGLTCLMSMLNATVESRRPITWVHGSRTTSTRAFTDHIRKLDARHDNLRAVLFVSHPRQDDVPGVDFHQSGRVALDRLNADKDLFLNDRRSQYFVCGPTSFIVDVQRGLRERGVEQDRVHAELFGTGGLPQA